MFEAGDIRQRRAELNTWQSELAAKVGVDKRQIRRCESGKAQPTLPIAEAIAGALGITIDELAGEDTHRINLTGDWWGLLADLERRHRGPQLPPDQHPAARRQAIHRHDDQGTQAYEEGGYLREGELRLWDNEILMGWYVATEGAVRPKGTM